MISTPSFFHTPTQEYVVPRSMPTATFLAMTRTDPANRKSGDGMKLNFAKVFRLSQNRYRYLNDTQLVWCNCCGIHFGPLLNLRTQITKKSFWGGAKAWLLGRYTSWYVYQLVYQLAYQLVCQLVCQLAYKLVCQLVCQLHTSWYTSWYTCWYAS